MHSVGDQDQYIGRGQNNLHLVIFKVSIGNRAQQEGGGIKSLHRAITAPHPRWRMTSVGVTNHPGGRFHLNGKRGEIHAMFGKCQCGVPIQCAQHCSGRNVRIFGNQSLEFTRKPRNGQCAGHSVASHIHHHNVNTTALGNTGVDEVTADFVGRHVGEVKLQMRGANGIRK